MTIKDLIFDPARIAKVSRQNLAERKQARDEGGLAIGLPAYIKTLDIVDPDLDGLIPLHRGEAMTIIARPGGGKTSYMMRNARCRAAEIRHRLAIGQKDAEKRVVVYGSWEQTVEDLDAFNTAAELIDDGMSITRMAMGLINAEQWARIEEINVGRIADPLWFVGYSAIERTRRPLMSVEDFRQALYSIQDDGLIIDSVFVDYLQRIPYRNDSKVEGISQNLDDLKTVFGNVGTCGVIGVQAKREVDERNDQRPTMSDGQWTSNIEQTSDKVLSLLRPSMYYDEGTSYGDVVVKGNQQMLISVLKQKLGPANFGRWVLFDTKYNKLNEAEQKHYDFRKQFGQDE